MRSHHTQFHKSSSIGSRIISRGSKDGAILTVVFGNLAKWPKRASRFRLRTHLLLKLHLWPFYSERRDVDVTSGVCQEGYESNYSWWQEHIISPKTS